MQRSFGHSRNRHGFSVIEAMIAVAIIGITLGAMMTLNGHQLRMVKVSRDMNAATLYQQERVEQLRQMRWPDLTSSTYISGTYMSNRPESKMALDQISESITISPYPTAVRGGQALSVSQEKNQSPVVHGTNNGNGLRNERLVKVELHLAWKGADGRPKERTTTTLVSISGVSRNNLPALGPVSGGPWSNFGTPAPSGGDGDGGGTGDPGDSGDPSTPTDPGDTDGGSGDTGGGTGNNGNGNGNGNNGNGNGNGNNGNGKGNNGKGNTGGQNGKG